MSATWSASGWDNAFDPIVSVRSGEELTVDTQDASAGQIGPTSTVQAVRDLDFGRVNPVSGSGPSGHAPKDRIDVRGVRDDSLEAEALVDRAPHLARLERRNVAAGDHAVGHYARRHRRPVPASAG